MCRMYHNPKDGFYIRLCGHSSGPKGHRWPATSVPPQACPTRQSRLRHQITAITRGENPFTHQRIAR